MEKANSNNTLKIVLGIFGIFAAIAVIAVIGIVVWIAMLPDGGVKLGHEMEPYASKYLTDNKIIEPDEKVLAFYDATMAMNSTEAAILTDRRLIYHIGGTTTSVLLQEVEDIRHRKEALIGDVLEAEDSSGTILKIEIAPLNQGETFKNAAMTAWKKAL